MRKSNHINQICALLKKHQSNKKTELNYRSNFELLISVILSAQATDVSVNKVTKELFKIAKTPKKIIELGELGLKKYIKTIGLYNAKSKNIIACCKKIVTDFNNKVPRNREDLESLPGVGRKTANVILNVAFGEPTIAVDTHVFRVSRRTGLSNGSTPVKVENDLMNIIPEQYLHDIHHLLIYHGRYICIARKPKCNECYLAEMCPSFNED